MNLTQVRDTGILLIPIEMLNQLAEMGISLNAEAGDDLDTVADWFAKVVAGIARHGLNSA